MEDETEGEIGDGKCAVFKDDAVNRSHARGRRKRRTGEIGKRRGVKREGRRKGRGGGEMGGKERTEENGAFTAKRGEGKCEVK